MEASPKSGMFVVILGGCQPPVGVDPGPWCEVWGDGDGEASPRDSGGVISVMASSTEFICVTLGCLARLCGEPC